MYLQANGYNEYDSVGKVVKKNIENPINIDLKGLEKILIKNGYIKRQGKGSHSIYKKGIISYKGNQYVYTIKDEIAFGEKAIKVVCKGAGMNEIFSPEDLKLVINDIIPSYLDIKGEDNKSSNLQIRIRKSDKEKIKKIAAKEKISLSDLIVKRVLENDKSLSLSK